MILSPRQGILLLEVKDWRRSTLVGATRDKVQLRTTRGAVTFGEQEEELRGKARFLRIFTIGERGEQPAQHVPLALWREPPGVHKIGNHLQGKIRRDVQVGVGLLTQCRRRCGDGVTLSARLS